MATKDKKWGPWVYDPRPKGWPPVQRPTDGRLRKLRKLVLECKLGSGGRLYRQPGSTFQMTLTPEIQQKLFLAPDQEKS